MQLRLFADGFGRQALWPAAGRGSSAWTQAITPLESALAWARAGRRVLKKPVITRMSPAIPYGWLSRSRFGQRHTCLVVPASDFKKTTKWLGTFALYYRDPKVLLQ